MHPNLQFTIEELDCAILEDWHRVTFRHDTRIEIEALAIKNCDEGGSEYSGVLIFKNSICDVTFLRNVNGHFKPKSDENRTTAKLVKSSRTGTIEETKPLIRENRWKGVFSGEGIKSSTLPCHELGVITTLLR